MQTHLEALLEDSAVSAVYRIVRDMGYGDFMERAHIKDSKIPILEAIAAGEPSALRLVERLQELSDIIREKKSAGDCKLIFSTIHSSKGLEYDTVYLIDAKDGIFPETVIKNRKGASKEELKLYEEERRLYYVGVTRAKNHLAIFRFPGSSTFTGELLDVERFPVEMPVKSRKTAVDRTRPYESVQNQTPKTVVSEQAYRDKLEELEATGYVKHKTLGEGVVLSIRGDVVEIDFGKKKSKCSLRFMMERGFIE
jgi:DNA helicase-2/ATP-dependent DNA helicase PcrA